MNTIIFGAIVLSLIILAMAISSQLRKKRADNVLAKYGLLQHKARQSQRAQEQAKNQAFFAQQ